MKPSFIQLSETVRIEAGFITKRALATPMTLSNDFTASHYVEGGIDALGKKIVMGKEFSYLDYKSRDRIWNVYKFEVDMKWLALFGDGSPRYVKKGSYHTKEEALEAAKSLME